MRALIVDDSRAMRAILRGTIAPLGFQTVEASNGKEALERVADSGPFELALVDWNMPVMNGLELVTAIRAQPDKKGMKLLMVTTEVEMAQVVTALTAGADEYVMKPFTNDVIRRKLEMVGLCAA